MVSSDLRERNLKYVFVCLSPSGPAKAGGKGLPMI